MTEPSVKEKVVALLNESHKRTELGRRRHEPGERLVIPATPDEVAKGLDFLTQEVGTLEAIAVALASEIDLLRGTNKG